MAKPAVRADDAADSRRRGLIDAALTVFIRFGYRKTSMEEVARAARVSRQALYLHFATKEELFRAALHTTIEGSFRAVTAILRDGEASLEARLVRAFDEWVGKYAGKMGADASDLVEAANTLVGPIVEDHEKLFADAITKAISGSRLAAAYKPAGLAARQLADTLHATARGLKYTSATREDFVRGMTVAVRAMCAPLAEAR